jgi:outer membrane protein TolC
VLICPGCKRVKIDKEFSRIQQRTRAITHSDIVIDRQNYSECMQYDETIIAQGMSLDEAIRIALQNNQDLQADFENLGVAKADLIQAGLFTNPTINSVFRFPTKTPEPGTGQTNIESTAALRLADLWQVPLNKRVAEDLLEIVSLRILTTILNIIHDVTVAYNACLQAQIGLENAQETMNALKKYQNQIVYRQKYGYSTDLDIYNATIALTFMQLEIIDYEAKIKTAYIHLKQLLAIDPTELRILLTQEFYASIPVPSLYEIESYALDNRPEIQIVQMKIKQYQDTIALEKARLWNDVDVGVSFKQDFEKPFHGWGFYFSLSIPVFDSNDAQIARAKFLLMQAKKEYNAEVLRVKEQVRVNYAVYEKYIREIQIYNNEIFPTHNKAIAWALRYAESMQENILVAIQTEIDFYHSQKKLIETQYNLLNIVADLERAAGKRIAFMS